MTEPSAIRTESIEVRRTALIASLGPTDPDGVRELWYVLHGQSMRAASFLGDCRALDDGDRLIIAPEALSRYYEGPIAANKNAIVVASWMTREEREDEIRDYVRYLDAVHAEMKSRFTQAMPPVTVLGFSQGGATAVRWVAEGNVMPARLIVWASSLPPEVDYATNSAIRAPTFTYVCGNRDIYVTPKVLDGQLKLLRDANLKYAAASFDGGHRLDDDTLRRVAGTVSSPSSQ